MKQYYKTTSTQKSKKHCKQEYKVLVPYSENTNIEIIEVKGKVYEIARIPRPCATYGELALVYVNGIKYYSFAKFLKSIS
jgi:hypothetical protein